MTIDYLTTDSTLIKIVVTSRFSFDQQCYLINQEASHLEIDHFNGAFIIKNLYSLVGPIKHDNNFNGLNVV